MQHSLGQYPPNYPVPVRPPSIKDVLLNAKKDVVKTDNELFADHGLHTMIDQMTGLEQEQIYLNFWKKQDEEGLKQ
jgi:hypothetical protein